MKIKTTFAALSLLSLISFGAAAADLISSEQASNLQSAGTITASGIGGAPMDIREALSQKADKQGAQAYRIIEARTGDSWHATAELYN